MVWIHGVVGSDVIAIRLRLYADVTSGFASESTSKPVSYTHLTLPTILRV